MIQHEDIYWCLFRLLMQRQAEEYETGPLDKVSRQLAAELTKMDQMRRSYDVAILLELTLWLREQHYHWYCSPEMKNSIMLYLLGITKIKPKLQRPSVWANADPTFEIVVQAEAFDKLEELFEDHWFIKDFYGKILGRLDDQGDRIVAEDFYGKILGTYNKSDDKTRDFYGRVISNGNTLTGLIAQAAAENEANNR